MLQEYAQRLNWAKSNKKLLNRFYAHPGNARGLDRILREAHGRAFACTDCLQCANCCKTTGPLFTVTDIQRLSKRLKLSEAGFTARYLKEDSEGDLVLRSVPCPFLMDDNRCAVYEDRPRACRSYPHTDEPGQKGIAHLTKKNATICPAVAHIFRELMTAGGKEKGKC